MNSKSSFSCGNSAQFRRDLGLNSTYTTNSTRSNLNRTVTLGSVNTNVDASVTDTSRIHRFNGYLTVSECRNVDSWLLESTKSAANKLKKHKVASAVTLEEEGKTLDNLIKEANEYEVKIAETKRECEELRLRLANHNIVNEYHDTMPLKIQASKNRVTSLKAEIQEAKRQYQEQSKLENCSLYYALTHFVFNIQLPDFTCPEGKSCIPDPNQQKEVECNIFKCPSFRSEIQPRIIPKEEHPP